ncbi:MAG: hypothetical protein ACLTDS_03675 [Bianqueaceae bacterium]
MQCVQKRLGRGGSRGHGRQLSIFCRNAKIYLALFANDFATSLAYLSFAAAAEMLAENMGEEFQLMLEDGMLCPEKYVW